MSLFGILRRRRRSESDFADEIRAHLALETERLVAEGFAPREAALEARRRFGNVGRVAEDFHDSRTYAWIDDAGADLRFAWRTLRNDRPYAAAAIGGLGIGIGVNVALFALFNAVALKPLTARAPERLVSIYATAPDVQFGWHPYGAYTWLRDHARSYSDLTVLRLAGLHLVSIGSNDGLPDSVLSNPERVLANFVSANYLTAFGVRTIAGRDLAPDDDRASGPPYAALLSANYWTRRFGANPSILGRRLTLSGTQVVVVGIAPRDFGGTRLTAPDVWISDAALGDQRRRALDWRTACCEIVGRLAPNVSIAQAQAEATALITQLHRNADPGDSSTVRVAHAVPFAAGRTGVDRVFILLQFAIALVLAIACSNAAALFLGRAAARRRELAVRLALGASRSRVARQLVTEGLVLATLAGALSLAVSWQTLTIVSRLVSEALASEGGTLAIDVTPDWRVIGYMVAISVVAGIAFALPPALQATRSDITSGIKDDPIAIGRFRTRAASTRGFLLAAQLSLCLTLLITAGLLTIGAAAELRVNPGFATTNVVVVETSDPSELGYSAQRATSVLADLRHSVLGMPGVASIATTTHEPLGGNTYMTRAVPSRSSNFTNAAAGVSWVSANYFATLGIDLTAGRTFSAAEVESNAPIAIVSHALAQRYWAGGSAIGQRLRLGDAGAGRIPGQRAIEDSVVTIVGVARDVRNLSIAEVDPAYVYLPDRVVDASSRLVVRTTARAGFVAGAIARQARELDPRLTVSSRTLADVMSMDAVVLMTRVGAWLFAGIGVLGFLLAAIGIYATVSYTVRQQKREIGIRLALGARQLDVIRSVISNSGRWIARGTATGALLGVGLWHVLGAFIPGENTTALGYVVAIAASTALLAVLAGLLSARAAASVDPAIALRG